MLLHNTNMQLTMSDLNTRFHAKTSDDTQIGKHAFGRGETFLKNIYLPETTNRSLLSETLTATESYAMNTFFQ